MCICCDDYNILLNLEEYSLKNNLFNKFSEIISKYWIVNMSTTKKIFCECCGNEIEYNEAYVEDINGFRKTVFKFMAKEIMKNIESCSECGNGAFISGMRGSIESIFDDEDDDPEQMFEEIDTSTELGELLSDILCNKNGSWEDYYNEIVKFIQCPNCDNGSGINYDDKINNGTFDLDTKVYTVEDIDKFNHSFYGDEMPKIEEEISEIAKKFTVNELVDLKNHYIRNKTYISCNELFNKLENVIEKCLKFNPYILDSKRIIFRTRLNNFNEIFDKYEMWEPPYKKAGQGRYNGIGEAVLYCANNTAVLRREVSNIEGKIYNYAMFRISNPLKLLPIDILFGRGFNGLIAEEVMAEDENDAFKEQYIISNIVSAIANKVGFNGIVYKSTKDKFSTNYAIFNYKKNIDIIPVCSFK